MTSPEGQRVPTRQEPPPFRRVQVRRIEQLSPRMRRVVVGGDELEGLRIDEPAASVRLLLPVGGELRTPTWTGNQFELDDGSRAPIRTFTPRHLDPEALELSIDVVVHDGGAASDWVASVSIGDQVAVSGPGRGYGIDLDADGYLLAGDETAIPAIAQLLEQMPPSMPVRAVIEVVDTSARLELPEHPSCEVSWHLLDQGAEPGSALVEAVTAMSDVPSVVWVAGEAASVQRLRKHLFEVRGLSRSSATVRGYWKKGRSAT